MGERKDYRAESRKNWYSTSESSLTIEEITLGCQLRIADATEAMAKNHVQLMKDRDQYKRWYDQKCEALAAAERSNTSLRGQITKLKKQIAALKEKDKCSSSST